MGKTKLYRRRFIPDEMVCLEDDVIEYKDDDILITRWKVLRPKKNFIGGRSCYFLKEGYKVSHFFDGTGKCVYTYCDIITTAYNAGTDEYIFSDLLIDVVVYEDGTVKLLDLGEISEALDKGLITVDMAKDALTKADSLLNIIYAGGLNKLTQFLSPKWLEGAQ